MHKYDAYEFPMTIDGLAGGTENVFGVVNPATEHCQLTSARRAQQSWKLDDLARQRALSAFQKELTRELEDMAFLLTLEQGKPLHESRAEVQQAVDWLGYYAALDLENEVVDVTAERLGRNFRSVATRHPVGVVAAITPWNAPVGLETRWSSSPRHTRHSRPYALELSRPARFLRVS
jgi:acyl-CoA reductase-like NAD-dependent aldehyde dehydrogenase